jgi:alkylhydroperoxidase family enzyme
MIREVRVAQGTKKLNKNKAKRRAGIAARRSPQTAGESAVNDDTKFLALALPKPELNAPMAAYFRKCEEKLGFVPNVLQAYAFDMAKLEAFVAMYNDLMLAPSGLSKLEREMKSLLLLSGRARRRGAAIVGRSAARRADGDELPCRAAVQAPAGDARLRRQAHLAALDD